MECKICSANASIFSETKILNKYDIKYYQCYSCGFIQTEEPYWLEESYSEVINRSDIGLLSRNIELVKITKVLISFFFDRNAKFIDYGAGYGVFVRLMRDNGIKFYWKDAYCENLFAKDFEAIKSDEKYQALTAYEVFEHLVNPKEEIEKMLLYSDSILFSTYLLPPNNPKPGEWWYYAVDHGQHVSIYTKKSIGIIAQKYGLNFYSNGKNIHLLTKKKINGFIFRFITYPYMSSFIYPLIKKHSLLDEDYKKVLKNIFKY